MERTEGHGEHQERKIVKICLKVSIKILLGTNVEP